MLTVAFPDQTWIDAVGEVPGIEPVVWDGSEGVDPPRRLDVFIAPYLRGLAPIEQALRIPGIRQVQLLTAGYDGIPELLAPGVVLSNAGSVHDDSTAELALALALACQRGIARAARSGARGLWEFPGHLPSLADRRVLLIGYGGVGRGIARRLEPFGVDLTVLATRARTGEGWVESVRPITELQVHLPTAEVVLVAVPLTDATRGLVGDGFLAALPDDALVVNVARGPVADTDAILRHAGRLRFGLDVTDPEPLPEDHPLLAHPDILITPHVGGATSAFRPRAIAMLRRQLVLIGAGHAPEHQVAVGTGRGAGR